MDEDGRKIEILEDSDLEEATGVEMSTLLSNLYVRIKITDRYYFYHMMVVTYIAFKRKFSKMSFTYRLLNLVY